MSHHDATADSGSALRLIVGLHDHQPVGQFGEVFEKAWDLAYGPFLEAAEAHPGFRFSLHVTGALLEWIESHHPEAIDRIRVWVRAGRIELIGGAFYEPVITSIPARDARGQIRAMRDYLERTFGTSPTGMWLAERVWRPDVPGIVAPEGVRYAIVDDTHLRHAGVPEEEIHGYYLTESVGHPLALFPIDKGLRYTIPFREPGETLDRLRSLHERGVRAVTYADDGEKLGLWPETHAWVHAQGWLERFLVALEDNASWLRTTTFAEALEELPPTGRAYPPTASYDEMTEWALPPRAQRARRALVAALEDRGLVEQARPFLRAGSFDHFLARYPEVNYLHKRMLDVSRRLAAAEDAGVLGLEGARRSLYRAQVNCPYWHGLFGGLYQNGIRQEAWRNLIAAESRLAQAGVDPPVLRVLDLDLDGVDEVLAAGGAISTVILPAVGGGLGELDVHRFPLNLLDVVARRDEAYHDLVASALVVGEGEGGAGSGGRAAEGMPPGDEPSRAGDDASRSSSAGAPGTEGGPPPASIHHRVRAKSPDLLERLVIDGYRRASAMDRLVDPGVDAAALRLAAEAGRLGGAPDLPYRLETAEVSGGCVSTIVSASRRCGGRAVALRKRFEIDVDRATIAVAVRLAPTGGGPLPARYAMEWNVTLLAPDGDDRRLLVNGVAAAPAMNAVKDHDAVRVVVLEDRWSGIRLELRPDRPVRLHRYPVETVSQSEDGFECSYQGTCLVLVWQDPPTAGEPFEAALTAALGTV